MVTLPDTLVRKIIERLINSQDYRIEIVNLINAEFLQYVVDFFQKVANAKLKNQQVTVDWYKAEFLSPNLTSDELIVNAGLNKKTISNMYNSARREIVIEATNTHYEQLYTVINSLVEQENNLDITLTLKLRGVSVDLNISESLIVINTLAVKRAELRGGAWSTVGKQVEKVLMVVLCYLYDVPTTHFDFTGLSESHREVDFYLIGSDGRRFLCEVKLMGKGNPESADVIIARDSDVFIADKLSDLNKQQLNKRGVRWLELRSANGFAKFPQICQALAVPHSAFNGDVNAKLRQVLDTLFANKQTTD